MFSREDDIADELATLSMEANKGREEEVDQNGLDEPIVTKKEKVTQILWGIVSRLLSDIITETEQLIHSWSYKI